jgi:hypothetical protein
MAGRLPEAAVMPKRAVTETAAPDGMEVLFDLAHALLSG